MAEPKKKLSRTRSGKRKSHLSWQPTKASKCPECRYLKQPHQVCPNCGIYKKEKIINVG